MVQRGDSTAQIADRLCVSSHTVQQHLKNVFEKTGVRSRRELIGKVFFSHYEPRVRDNERRVIDGDPCAGVPSVARGPSKVLATAVSRLDVVVVSIGLAVRVGTPV